MTERSSKTFGPLTASPVIKADNLACRRGDKQLFEDLSFALSPGEAMFLIGPNGSGKSSLLRILAGFLPPVAGHLTIEGIADNWAHAKSRIAYVGHANPLKPVLTVEANRRFQAALAGGENEAVSIEAFGVDEIASTPARYLSSGQKRRATLASTLRSDRPVWLLDEPGVGLDRNFRGRLERVVQGHLASGGVVIAASHGDFALPNPLILDFAEAGR